MRLAPSVVPFAGKVIVEGRGALAALLRWLVSRAALRITYGPARGRGRTYAIAATYSRNWAALALSAIGWLALRLTQKATP